MLPASGVVPPLASTGVDAILGGETRTRAVLPVTPRTRKHVSTTTYVVLGTSTCSIPPLCLLFLCLSLNSLIPAESNSTMSTSYDAADNLEKSGASLSEAVQRVTTKGGHEDDRSQPALPVVHRSFANPAPLGLLSFATGMFPRTSPLESTGLTDSPPDVFLISVYGVHAQGVYTPNVLVAMLTFFGGIGR
jgi:hypothetical protein